MRSECGTRGRAYHLPPGGSGIILPALGPAREVLTGLGQAGADNARGDARGLRPPVGAAVQDRTLPPRPRKHGLMLSLGRPTVPLARTAVERR